MPPWVVRMVAEQFHRDDEGRLLRESRAPAHVRPGEIQHRTCPYAGERRQHPCPMNASALRQTAAHWSDIVDALALLRLIHAEQRGPGAPGLMDLWRVSQLGSALPWFYLLRASSGERCPAFAAALAKATQGVGLWAQRALAEQLAGAPPVELTAVGILAAVEASGTLVGEAEVCAGSEAMLRRFFDVLVDGTPTVTSPALARLAAEQADVLTFGAHYASFKLLLWILSLARHFVYSDLLAAVGPHHPLAAPLGALRDAGCDPPDFFLIAPPEPAAVPLANRAAWLDGVATLVVPLAPDGSDGALRAAALAIAHVSGASIAPAELVAEVRTSACIDEHHATIVARALLTYARLDAILGEVAAAVELGFRCGDRGATPPTRFDAAARDALIATPPRAVLARLAPVGLAAHCPA